MLLRGRWLVGHVLVIVVAVTFVALGFWQLARHHEKHDKVRAARAALAAPAPDVTKLDSSSPVPARVEGRGTYDGAHEILLRNRVRDGHAGTDVLTPLRLADGTVVLVDRGWVSSGASVSAAPTGDVVVRGLARASSPIAPGDTVDRRGSRLALPRVDLDRVEAETGVDLRPVWIEAQAQTPAPDRDDPRLPEPPPPDQVNHLQYAIQWWSFALVPLVGWPILLVRLRRQRNRLDTSRR